MNRNSYRKGGLGGAHKAARWGTQAAGRCSSLLVSNSEVICLRGKQGKILACEEGKISRVTSIEESLQ